jgi:hypothetical protein
MAIPRTDNELRSFAVNLISQCDTNKTAWGIPADAITALQALSTAYGAALQTAESPDRRKSDVTAKNEAKEALLEGLRTFIGKHLEYNEAITDPIRESLGLSLKDKIRTPVPRPSASPVFYIQIKAPRLLDIHFKPEGAAGSARPYGYNGAVIRYAVLDTPPASAEALPKSLLATKTPHTFEFTEAERDKKAYFAMAWQNDKGELGPFSEVQSENVP